MILGSIDGSLIIRNVSTKERMKEAHLAIIDVEDFRIGCPLFDHSQVARGMQANRLHYTRMTSLRNSSPCRYNQELHFGVAATSVA